MATGRICTICARGGSKGVPNKNSRLLLGKPLISYSVEAARHTEAFDHIVISTDSDAIAEAAVSAGAEVFFHRPAELATDTAAKLPVIRHALLESEKHYQCQFPVLVDLDATSPLRTAEDILGAIQYFVEGDWDNLITGMAARRSPYFNLVEMDPDGRVKLSKQLDNSIVRRQDAPRCFDMNASIYIWKRESLLNGERVISDNTGLYIMPEERSIDIDSELDFLFVEFLMQRSLHGNA